MDHFNASEERAWNSAAPLKTLIANRAATFSINGASKVRLYAHSMGNVVCSEALRQFGSAGAPVHTYIAAQAAISSHVFDRTTAPRVTVDPQDMPNVYGYYWKQGDSDWPPQWQIDNRPSYMDAQYVPSGVTFINHFNIDDYALNGNRWPLNQSLKPASTYSYLSPDGNLNDPATRRFRRQRLGEFTATVLDFPDDRYEIFSYAASSAGHALGKMGDTGGVFSSSLDVATMLVYDGEAIAHKYHSGQFRSTIQKRWEYWDRTLTDFLILHNQP